MSALYNLKVYATDWPEFSAEIPLVWHGGIRQLEPTLKIILSGYASRHGNFGWYATMYVFIPLPPEGERANYEPWKPMQSYAYSRRGSSDSFKLVKTTLQYGRMSGGPLPDGHSHGGQQIAKAMTETPAWAAALGAPYGPETRYRKDTPADPYVALAADVLRQSRNRPQRPVGWPVGLLDGGLFYPTGRAERRERWLNGARTTKHPSVFYAYRWTKAMEAEHTARLGPQGESRVIVGGRRVPMTRHIPARGELIAADLTFDEASAIAAYFGEHKPEEGYTYGFTKQFIGIDGLETVFEGCHASRDGDCDWANCPQNKIGEPMLTGRHCPLDRGNEDDC
jgi:hypothetical protein